MRFRIFIETCFLIMFGSGICLSNDEIFISMAGDCRYPSVATEGNSMVMAWLVAEGNQANLYFRRSMDEGKTWNSSEKISNENGDCLPPSIAVNSGIVHVAWIDHGETIDGELYYARSPDGGETWGKKFILVKNTNNTRYPLLICRENNVYLVWQDGQNQVSFKASYDKGRTWEQETLLGKVGTHSCFCFPPAFSVTGNELVVAWADFREEKKLPFFSGTKKMISSIVCRTSADKGHTWGKKCILARCKVSKEMKDEIDNPIMISNDSLSYLFWLDRRNVELGEIYYSQFDPKVHKGFLTGKNLYPYPKRSPKRPSAVIDKDGNVHFTWATFFGGQSIVHYGEIDPAGNILKERKDLTSDVGRYHNPILARTPSGLLYLFWFNEPKNKNTWSTIFLKTSKDNGLTWENWEPQTEHIQD
jgi:hypothetical protein